MLNNFHKKFFSKKCYEYQRVGDTCACLNQFWRKIQIQNRNSKIANFKRNYLDNDNDSEFTVKQKMLHFHEFSEYIYIMANFANLRNFQFLHNLYICVYLRWDSEICLDHGAVSLTHHLHK